MASKKTQSPIFNQVLTAFKETLITDESISDDQIHRLVHLLENDTVPNPVKIQFALFTSPDESD